MRTEGGIRLARISRVTASPGAPSEMRGFFITCFVSAVVGCSSTEGAGTATDAGSSGSSGSTTDGGGGGSDAGSSSGDAATPSSCAALVSSGQPYVCFTISGGGLPTTYEVGYPRVPPAAFQVYFGLTAGRAFFRMNGLPKVNGASERVAIDFTFGSTSPGTEAWRTDIGGGGAGPVIIFFGPDIGGGDSAERREFRPIEGSTDLGSTVITRFGAVGELVEGTFNGIGMLDQRVPAAQIFDRVNITGSFRVTRAPDA